MYDFTPDAQQAEANISTVPAAAPDPAAMTANVHPPDHRELARPEAEPAPPAADRGEPRGAHFIGKPPSAGGLRPLELRRP